MSTARAWSRSRQIRRIFRRYTLIDTGEFFFALVLRFPPSRKLWFWWHRDERWLDVRVWPLDFLWEKK